MKEIAHNTLDCQSMAEAMVGKINITEMEDLTGKVPHVGMGGASKSKYTSPKTGKEVFILERTAPYDSDGYITDVWQFSEDFTAEQAAEFLAGK